MLGVLFSRLSLRTSHIGFFFFFSSRRRHTRLQGDWSSDVCSSDLFYSTAGVAVTSIQWKVARQFAFFENNLSWKRYMTLDRKSTRLNSSHLVISYAVFCLKKKIKF